MTSEPKRTGAHLVVDALVAASVQHLFSLSGNQILSVYDATIGRDLSIIHTRHEAAAVHMADAWVANRGAGGRPGHRGARPSERDVGLYGALMAESPVVLRAVTRRSVSPGGAHSRRWTRWERRGR